MEEYRISPTRSTLAVILKPEGIIKIKGCSIPENTLQFFEPINNWISEYILNPAEITYVDIYLMIVNADTCKYLIQILQKITYVSLKKKKFVINWYFENEDQDIIEIGNDLSKTLGIPFNFIKLLIDSEKLKPEVKNNLKESEKTPMEKHPNYQRHLDELAKLDPKKRKRMEDYYSGFLMQGEEETHMKDFLEKKEQTSMERHPNYQKIMDELANLSMKEREEMEEHCRKYMMDEGEDNNMKDLIEKKAQEARDYFNEKAQKTLEALPKEKQEEMLKHIQQFWQTDGISIKLQNTEQPMKDHEERKNKTIWQRMEEESNERIAKYDPKKFKEMVDRWSGGLTEDEIDTEPQSNEPQITEQPMTEKPIKKQKKFIPKRSFIILLIVLIVILFIGGSIFAFYLSIQRYNEFYGSWELKAPQKGLDGFIIKNISIYKSKNLSLVYVKGDIYGEDWGPLLFVAKKSKGILEVEPSKYYGIGRVGQTDRYESLNTLLTQPFKIFYSSEYDRIIVGNAFFVRGKEVVWNN